MKAVIAIVLLLGIGAGAYFLHLPQKLGLKLPSKAALTLPEGKVAGISTEAPKVGASLFQKGGEIGTSISNVFLSESDQKTGNVEVDKVVSQVSKQIESIPSTLLEKAKVAYCQQVLVEATRSASPNK